MATTASIEDQFFMMQDHILRFHILQALKLIASGQVISQPTSADAPDILLFRSEQLSKKYGISRTDALFFLFRFNDPEKVLDQQKAFAWSTSSHPDNAHDFFLKNIFTLQVKFQVCYDFVAKKAMEYNAPYKDVLDQVIDIEQAHLDSFPV